MHSDALPDPRTGPSPALAPRLETRTFEQVYDELFPFVWRVARRLGTAESALDDVCQETFLVVHRRLSEFEQRSSLKTWVYGILHHVVQGHKRTQARKSPGHRADAAIDLESLAGTARGPDEAASDAQSTRIAHAMLAQLDDDKRSVFVLVELEGLSVPEVADATGLNVNTIYARLRAARSEFSATVARFHAAERRRTP